ncbi:rhotekin-2 [Ambystoma mexicanum]|uniref:rhotekin-2 n=1 Tax=Ambystoma mexicanum TaxID=8296 RepID=UPI0037E9570F
MAEQRRRDFQMFKRAERCRATVSKCSALGMEIKRKKIRESAVFLEQEDGSIQEKIDFEFRIREGICKLLAVSTQKEQALHAVKNLMTCNARILAYMSELQNQRQEQMETQAGRRSSDIGANQRAACPGKVAISDIRIPLLWKNSDHFSNKESSQRYAVFCMLKMGTAVFDTDMAIVDKTMTDISFEKVTIFNEARPDFEIKLEVYSCCVEEPFSSNTPKKLVQKLRRSLGKSSVKKNFSLDGGVPENVFFNTPAGAKYSLLAQSTLTLDSAEDTFRTHSLSITGHEESSFWLPLYGNVCCRVVAQPTFMTEDVIKGFLNQKLLIGNVFSLKRIFCVLRGVHLLGYYTPEEIEAKVEPFMKVPVNKETRIRSMNKDSSKRSYGFSIINPIAGEATTQIFMVDSREDLQSWMEAFWQHFYDLSQWKHCSEALIKFYTSPRKPPLFMTKEATSVYHDMSIGSPMKFESLTDLIHNKIEETDGQFLICSKDETADPPWAAMFDGSRQMHVQKNMADEELKRTSPAPPFDASQCLSKSLENANQTEKENICTNANVAPIFRDLKKTCLNKPFKSPKTSTLKMIAPSQLCKMQDGSVCDGPEIVTQEKPVPLPRIRSLKEKKRP